MLKRRTGSSWGLLALALILGGAAQAAQTPKTVTQKAPASHDSSGTIDSINATRLVMSRKIQGKNEQVTVVLTPETKREGTLTTGSKVVVKSHLENSDEVATSLRGSTTSAKTKATATDKKS